MLLLDILQREKMECVATSIALDIADSFPGSPTSQSEDSKAATHIPRNSAC